MAYLDTIKDKRVSAQTTQKTQADLDSMIQQLKEVQLASLMNGNKSSVVLADSTDFGEKIDKLNTSLEKMVTGNTVLIKNASDKQVEMIDSIVSSIRKSLSDLKPDKHDDSKIVDKLDKLLKEFKKDIKVSVSSPSINVPAIKIPTINIDTQPIVDAMSIKEQIEKFDLQDYYAQDISESDGKQHIGFVNATGNWYIIENDINGNTLRYAFGGSGYSKSFKKASSYIYKTLDEAVNAL